MVINLKYEMERTVYLGGNTAKIYVPAWVVKAMGLKNMGKVKVTFEAIK